MKRNQILPCRFVAAAGVSTTFNVNALPVTVTDVGDWNGFMAAGGPAIGRNVTYTDPATNTVMRRITDATFPVANTSVGIMYATGGRDWSMQFGTRQKHLIFGTEAGVPYMMDYKYGVGSLEGTIRSLSGLFSASRLAFCWSKKANEPHILYIGIDGTDLLQTAQIRRYDVNAAAYAPNAVFNGTNASIQTTGKFIFWMQQNWDGSGMSWHSTDDNGNTYCINYLEVNTGTNHQFAGTGPAYGTSYNVTGITRANPCVVTIGAHSLIAGDYVTIDGCGGMTQINATGGISVLGGSPGYFRVTAATGTTITLGSTGNIWGAVDSSAFTAYTSGGTAVKTNNVNDIRICAGTKHMVALAGNARDKAFWFVDSGHVTAWTQALEGYGHSDYLEDNYWPTRGDNYSAEQSVTEGTDPGQGGAWNGSTTDKYYPYVNGVPIFASDQHPAKGWVCSGLGPNQYLSVDTDVVTNDGVAAGYTWSVNSGSVYKSTAISFVSYTVGMTDISGVVRLNASTDFIGNFTRVGSIGAIGPGNFFFDTGTKICYLQMPDSSNPTGFVLIKAYGFLSGKIGLLRADGNRDATYCHTFRHDENTAYPRSCFHTQSSEGDLMAWNSTMGVHNGRCDVWVAEGPLA